MMVDVNFKMFLDRPEILKRIDTKRRRVLFRTGGFGRQVMKRQMRKGGKKRKQSKPGEAPRTHVGLLRKLIYFGLADDGETVVIGPQYTGQSRTTQAAGGKPVPQLLNEGGRAALAFPDGNVETVEYLPRPFIDPVRPTIQEAYENNIKETPL